MSEYELTEADAAWLDAMCTAVELPARSWKTGPRWIGMVWDKQIEQITARDLQNMSMDEYRRLRPLLLRAQQ